MKLRRISTTRRVAALTAVFAASLALVAPGAAAQARWRNHVDASLINEIVQGGQKLYCSSLGGLLVLDLGTTTFTQFTNVDGLTSNSLTCLAFGNDGHLLVGTSDIGLLELRVSDASLTLVKAYTEQIDGLADNGVTTVAAWGDSIAYGTRNGMGLIVDGFPTSPRFKRDGLPDDRVNDVFPWGEFVWIATDSGVVVLDRLGLLRGVSGAPAQANVLASDGSLLHVGTDDGVRSFDPADSSWANLGLAGFPIDAMFEDGQTLWATSTSKLWEYQGTSWGLTRFDTISSLYSLKFSESTAPGLAVTPGPVAYVALGRADEQRGAGLVRTDRVVSEVLLPNGPGADIQRLSFDPVEDALWASFFNFYVGKLMPDGRWLNYNQSIPASDSLSNRSSNLTCLADSRGDKWFCSLSSPGDPSPLDRLSDGRDDDYANDRWEHLTVGSGGGDGLGSLRLQRAVEDPAGNLWFLSDEDQAAAGWQGIQIYNPALDEWLQVTPEGSAMASGDVVAVAFESFRTHVAMRNYGVQAWSHNGYSWGSLTGAPGDTWVDGPTIGDELSGTSLVTSLALRPDGFLWIGTDDGLYKWDGDTQAAELDVNRIGAFSGLEAGLLSPKVNDLALDRDGNLWVATQSGVNRIARADDADIAAFSTAAEYQRKLSQLRYPLDVISPLVHENCKSLVVHPTRDVLYIGTHTGLSVYDFSPPPRTPTDLSRVYVYPNPVHGRKGQDELKIENITGPVTVEVYDMEGELVHTGAASQPGDVIWDLTTNDGFLAASGTYLVRIRAEGGAVVRLVAVLR